MHRKTIPLIILSISLAACRCSRTEQPEPANKSVPAEYATMGGTSTLPVVSETPVHTRTPNTQQTDKLASFVARYGEEVTCIPNLEEGVTAQVTRVIDGDSIEVRIGNEVIEVRYIGINTPEYYSDKRPQAIAATRANQELLTGMQVMLFKDVSEADKFGRLLRYVLTDEAFVNLALVEGGFAEARLYRPDSSCHNAFENAAR